MRALVLAALALLLQACAAGEPQSSNTAGVPRQRSESQDQAAGMAVARPRAAPSGVGAYGAGTYGTGGRYGY